ncbi:DNA endonuclease RBBP8-like isoform X2 [Branchiostoma lanceolatum]|uniref:DNA endonuclease RBBP8-like isoform X2 n=1 Tax=Branchiostoma lanceolatum TaxID=7740 RepID=UPI0034533B34
MSGPSLSGLEAVLSPVTSPDQTDQGAKFSQLLMELNQTHQHQVTGFQQRCQELDRSRKHYYTELKKALGAMKNLKTENQRLQEQLRSTSGSKDACKSCATLQGALQQKEEELKSIRQEREQYVKSQEAQMKDLQNRLSELLSLQASNRQGQNLHVQNKSKKIKEPSAKDEDTSSDKDVPVRMEEGGQTEEVTIPYSDSQINGATKQVATRLHRQNKRVRYKENVKTSPDREEGKTLRGRQKKPLMLADTQGEFTQQLKMSRILVPDTLAVEASTESDEQNSQTENCKEEKENRKLKYHKANYRTDSSSAEEVIKENDPSGDPACDPITMIPDTMAMEDDHDETRMLMSPPSCSSTPVNYMGKPGALANQKPPRNVVTNQQPASRQVKCSAAEQPQQKVLSAPDSPEADMSPPVSPTFGRPACPAAVHVSTTNTTCESPLLFGDNVQVGTRVEESCQQKKVPTSQEIQPLRKAPNTSCAGSPSLQSPLVFRVKAEPVTQVDSDVSPLLLGVPKVKVKQEPRGHDPTRLTLRREFDKAAAAMGPSGMEVGGELEETEDTQQELSTKRRNRTSKTQEKRATRRSTRAATRVSEAVRSSPRVKNSQQNKKNSRGGKRKTCFDDDSDISEDDGADIRPKGKSSRNKRVMSSQSSSKQKGGAPTEGSPGLKQLTLTQAMFNQKTELHRSKVFQGGLRKREPPQEDSDLRQALELSRKETSPHAVEEEEAVRLAVQRSIHDITNTREPGSRSQKHGGAKTRNRNTSAQSTSSETCRQALEDTFDPDSTFMPGKFKVPGVPSTSTQKDTQFQSQQYTNGPLNGSLDPDIQLTELDTTTLPVDSQVGGEERIGRGRKRNDVVKSGRGKTDISRLFDETTFGGEEGEDMDAGGDLGTPEVMQGRNVGKYRRKEQVGDDSDSCSDLFEVEDEWEADDPHDEEEDEQMEDRAARRGPRNLPNNLADFDRVPKKDAGPDYKYSKVVRKKDERRKLHGHDCQCCKDWYGDMSESQKKLRMKATSRHRQQHSPTSTPPHFWSLGFPDTQECKTRGYLKATQTPPPRKKRRRPYKQKFSPVKKGQKD